MSNKLYTSHVKFNYHFPQDTLVSQLTLTVPCEHGGKSIYERLYGVCEDIFISPNRLHFGGFTGDLEVFNLRFYHDFNSLNLDDLNAAIDIILSPQTPPVCVVYDYLCEFKVTDLPLLPCLKLMASTYIGMFDGLEDYAATAIKKGEVTIGSLELSEIDLTALGDRLTMFHRLITSGDGTLVYFHTPKPEPTA